jgi:deoxyribonuclease-4
MRTSEDYAELFEKVRTGLGGSKFYCHFAGVEHRMGNALHYTQIKKSDLKFEPFAEFLAEDGDWMDLTIISDSPLLEHDAMFMQQHHDKARERLLEIRARDERRMKIASQAGMSPEELHPVEEEESPTTEDSGESSVAQAEPEKAAPKPKKSGKMMSFDDDSTDDDDLF